MKIFAWRSDLLKQYATGSLLAVADNADAAREKIRGHFDAWVKERYEWLSPESDHDDAREVASLRDKLEKDLKPDPVEHDVLYISGSE